MWGEKIKYVQYLGYQSIYTYIHDQMVFMIIVFQNTRGEVQKARHWSSLILISIFLKPTLPFQLHGFVNESCLDRLVVSRTLTCCRAFVHVNDRFSVNTKKTHNFITTINQNETNNIATQGTWQICETHIRSCIIWSTTPWLEQTLWKLGFNGQSGSH